MSRTCSLAEAAGKADPFVFYRFVMMAHVVELDRQSQFGGDEAPDRGGEVELGDRAVVLGE
jgi:hypothetical protein